MNTKRARKAMSVRAISHVGDHAIHQEFCLFLPTTARVPLSQALQFYGGKKRIV